MHFFTGSPKRIETGWYPNQEKHKPSKDHKFGQLASAHRHAARSRCGGSMLRAPRRATPGRGVCCSQREPPPGDSPALAAFLKPCLPAYKTGLFLKMEPLSHERAGNIALTFTQSPMGSQRASVERKSILNFIEFQLVGEMVFTADAVTLSATVCDVCRCWRGGKGCCSMPQYGVISVSLGVYKSAQIPRFE